MLGPNELQDLAKSLGGDSAPPAFEGAASSAYMDAMYDDDVEKLDFKYVESCTDVKELDRLLTFLKSGKEGFYPELERTFQQRMEFLDPSLKKPEPTAIQAEMASFAKEMKDHENSLKSAKRPSPKTRAGLTAPSVPSTTTSKQAIVQGTQKEPSTESKSRIKSGDYRAWDKFKVDDELAKIDDQKEIKSPVPTPKPKVTLLPQAALLSLQERKYMAEMEKIKGNECFKSSDFADAVTYYSRSIELFARPNVYTNRSIAYIKLKQYENAESDTTLALAFNEKEFHFKAYLRRAIARKYRSLYEPAIQDLEAALALEPEQAEAVKLLGECRRALGELTGPSQVTKDKIALLAEKKKDKYLAGRKKMVIEEHDGVEDEVLVKPTESQSETRECSPMKDENSNQACKAEIKPIRKKMAIIEVDEDDLDMKDSVCVSAPLRPSNSVNADSGSLEASDVKLNSQFKAAIEDPMVCRFEELDPKLEAPESCIDMERQYHQLKGNSTRLFSYLLLISPDKFPILAAHWLDSTGLVSIFKCILDACRSEFPQHRPWAAQLMVSIAFKLPRVKTIFAFMSKREVVLINELLFFVEKDLPAGIPPAEICAALGIKSPQSEKK